MSGLPVESEVEKAYEKVRKVLSSTVMEDLRAPVQELKSKNAELHENGQKYARAVWENGVYSSVEILRETMKGVQALLESREKDKQNASELLERTRQLVNEKRKLRREFDKQIRIMKGCPEVFLRLKPCDDPDKSIIQFPFTSTIALDNNLELMEEYDRVFKPLVSNRTFYKRVNPIVSRLYEGQNSAVLFYGASHSGKTYSLLGNADREGILSLALKDMEGNSNYWYSISAAALRGREYLDFCDPDFEWKEASSTFNLKQQNIRKIDVELFVEHLRNKKQKRSNLLISIACMRKDDKVCIALPLTEVPDEEGVRVALHRARGAQVGAGGRTPPRHLSRCLPRLQSAHFNEMMEAIEFYRVDFAFDAYPLTSILKHSVQDSCKFLFVFCCIPDEAHREDLSKQLEYKNSVWKCPMGLYSQAIVRSLLFTWRGSRSIPGLGLGKSKLTGRKTRKQLIASEGMEDASSSDEEGDDSYPVAAPSSRHHQDSSSGDDAGAGAASEDGSAPASPVSAEEEEEL